METESVWLNTDLGDLLLEVYVSRAPLSSDAFLRYVDAGRYNGATFCRTVRPDNDHGTAPTALVQATVIDSVGLHPRVAHEPTAVTGIHHLDGTLSLARLEPGSASPAHFFICIGEQPSLDFGGGRAADGQGFAAFGRLIEGFELVRRIHRARTLPDAPDPYMKDQMLAEPIVIRAARRKPASF